VRDLDHTNTVRPQVQSVSAIGVTNGLSTSTLLAMLSVDAGTVIGNTATTGTVNWIFNSGTEAFNHLADGETLTLVYTVAAQDDHAAPSSDTEVVTITLVGTNDKPTVASTSANARGTVIEAGHNDDNSVNAGSPITRGRISGADLDGGAVLVYELEGTISERYGRIVLDRTTGAWVYTLDNSLTATHQLREGESVVEPYTVKITDDRGAVVRETIRVTINGSNDQPTANGNLPAASYLQGERVSVATAQLYADIDVGAGAFTYSAQLPPGLSIDPASGLITGAPTRPGDYVAIIRATDAQGAWIETSWALRINAPARTDAVPSSGSQSARPSTTSTAGTGAVGATSTTPTSSGSGSSFQVLSGGISGFSASIPVPQIISTGTSSTAGVAATVSPGVGTGATPGTGVTGTGMAPSAGVAATGAGTGTTAGGTASAGVSTGAGSGTSTAGTTSSVGSSGTSSGSSGTSSATTGSASGSVSTASGSASGQATAGGSGSAASGGEAGARTAPTSAPQQDGGRTQANVGADGQLQVRTAQASGAQSGDNTATRSVERVDVSVSTNGQVRLQQQAARGDESPTGIMIVEVVQQRGALQVEVADFRKTESVQYRATLPDGSPLPSWIVIDTGSGKITADPPPNAQLIDIRLVAQDPAGGVRTLEIKIDLSTQGPRSEATPTGTPVVDARPSFMRQVDAHHQQWGGYGQQLMSAFNEQPIES
jgi:VCBS repeat-containing protein